MSCKDCTERHYLCHSTCDRYLKWKQEQAELKAKIKAEKELYKSLWQASRHNPDKHRRRRRPYADNSG